MIASSRQAIRALVERYSALDTTVQSRVGRHEVAPLMNSVIEPFRTRVELTLREYANLIANTNAAAASTAAAVNASRVEAKVCACRRAQGVCVFVCVRVCAQAVHSRRLRGGFHVTRHVVVPPPPATFHTHTPPTAPTARTPPTAHTTPTALHHHTHHTHCPYSTHRTHRPHPTHRPHSTRRSRSTPPWCRPPLPTLPTRAW